MIMWGARAFVGQSMGECAAAPWLARHDTVKKTFTGKEFLDLLRLDQFQKNKRVTTGSFYPSLIFPQ